MSQSCCWSALRHLTRVCCGFKYLNQLKHAEKVTQQLLGSFDRFHFSPQLRFFSQAFKVSLDRRKLSDEPASHPKCSSNSLTIPLLSLTEEEEEACERNVLKAKVKYLNLLRREVHRRL